MVQPFVVPFFYTENQDVLYAATFDTQAVKDQFIALLKQLGAIVQGDWQKLPNQAAAHDAILWVGQHSGTVYDLKAH